jgi:lipopolysaccharide biosynthesis regulator YciM
MLDMSVYYLIGLVLLAVVLVLLLASLFRRSRRKPDAKTLYIEALQALLQGDEVRAFYRLKETVSQDSDNIDAYIWLGKILARRGNTSSAIQVHSELLVRSNVTPEQMRIIRLALIEDYVQDDQVDKAVELLEREHERFPRDNHISERLLDLLMSEDRWEEAVAIAERAFKHDHGAFRAKYARALVSRGDYLQREGKGKKARIAYKEAHKVDESRVDTWVKIGDSYLQENRVDDAIKSWRTLTEISPRSSHLVIDRLSKSLFDLGKYNAIGGILEGILEKDPDNRDAALALADLNVKKGNYGRAEEYYQRVLAVEPDYLPAAVGLARSLREQGRTDEALNSLEQVYSHKGMVAEEG